MTEQSNVGTEQPRAGQGEKRCDECDEIVDLHYNEDCPNCGEYHYVINEGGIFDGV